MKKAFNPLDLLPFGWKTNVLVIEKRRNGNVYQMGKYRRKQTKDDDRGELKIGMKVYFIPPIKLKHIDVTNSGKGFIILFTPNNEDFFPVHKNNIDEDITLKLTDVDREQFRKNKLIRAIEKRKKTSALLMAIPLITILVAGVMLYLVMGQQIDATAQSNERADAIIGQAIEQSRITTEATNRLIDAIESMGYIPRTSSNDLPIRVPPSY